MQFNKIILVFFLLICIGCSTDSANESFGAGQGGSMTRFAINGNMLYVVDRSSINVFDITGENFVKVNTVEAGPGMETIFTKGEFLYLGAIDGMYIYSITDPQNPSFIFKYSHIASCDPVVVQGNRAYVTLRGGTSCNRGIDALEIIDISDPNSPRLIANYQMQSPHGLAVKDNLLFLCEGEHGFKVFNITNELEIREIHDLHDFHAYDVIARSNQLIITGDDGIFQYTYTPNADDLTLISAITVNRTEL